MQLDRPTDAPPRRMTLAEWADMREDEPGELQDGLLVEEEMPDGLHEVTVAWLVHMLRAWIAVRGGVVMGSEAKFAVRPGRGRKPDTTVYLPGRRPPMRGLIRVPPDIAVEVVSTAPSDVRRDRVEKLDEYAAFGVRFYWIIDPAARSFEVCELGSDGRYVHALGATGGQVQPPGCADLTLDLDSLWSELDRLLQDDTPA